MTAMQEEIFGPVLPVLTYRTLDEAIVFVNARARPLALYYFDDDVGRQDAVLARTMSGGVTLNDCVFHLGQDNLPIRRRGAQRHGAQGHATSRTASNDTDRVASAPWYSGPTTASSQRRAWWSASLPPRIRAGRIIVAGVAGLIAGALSMAAGEYVSVSSQADTERADLKRERHELAEEPDAELRRAGTGIYVRRGTGPSPRAHGGAATAAARDPLAAHARDELGLIRRACGASPAGGALLSGCLCSRGSPSHCYRQHHATAAPSAHGRRDIPSLSHRARGARGPDGSTL